MQTESPESTPPPTIAWFRRDLRLRDNPALIAAMERGPVAPLFVFDPRFLSPPLRSANRLWFLCESLRSLDLSLRERGSRLHFRVGDPAEEVARLAAECGAVMVSASRDYSTFGRRRDEVAGRRLRAIGVELRLHRGQLSREPEEVQSGTGEPYRVFTAFLRRWRSIGVPSETEAPTWVATPPGIPVGGIPRVFDVRAEAVERPQPGESAALGRLRSVA